MKDIRKITIGDYIVVGLLLTVMFAPLTLFLKGISWFEILPVFGIAIMACGTFLWIWYVSLFPTKVEEGNK